MTQEEPRDQDTELLNGHRIYTKDGFPHYIGDHACFPIKDDCTLSIASAGNPEAWRAVGKRHLEDMRRKAARP